MKTLDQILFDLPEEIPNVDKKANRVFNGFKKYIKSHGFLTERQSEYLLALYTTNIAEITPYAPDISDALTDPAWSQPFKRILTTRTIKMVNEDNKKCIEVAFTYSNSIKRILARLPIGFDVRTPTVWVITRPSETNIIDLVNALLPHTFIIDKEIMDLYNQINGWVREEVISKFSPAELGFDNYESDLITYDRRIRHQYMITPPEPTNLTETIAYRPNQKIWIDLHNNTIHDIINSIRELNRFPLMVVLPNQSNASCKWLLELSTVIQENNISNVGVYVRETGESNFNKLISTYGYNARLDENTNIAVCQINKLPKIFLSSGWKPMSILVIETQLRVNAVANYAKQFCDLIITAADEPPFTATLFNR